MKVYTNINDILLQNAKFLHADTSTLYIASTSLKTISIIMLLPVLVSTISIAWFYSPVCWRSEDKEELVMDRMTEKGKMRKKNYCFWGENLLFWYKVLAASREMNYWLEIRCRAEREDPMTEITPTNQPPMLILCPLNTHKHTRLHTHTLGCGGYPHNALLLK